MFRNSLEVSTYTTHKLLCIVSTPLPLTSIYNGDLLPKKEIEAIQYFPYVIHRGWQSSLKWFLKKPCESQHHRVTKGTNISETWKVNFGGKSQTSASFRFLRSKPCPQWEEAGEAGRPGGPAFLLGSLFPTTQTPLQPLDTAPPSLLRCYWARRGHSCGASHRCNAPGSQRLRESFRTREKICFKSWYFWQFNFKTISF